MGEVKPKKTREIQRAKRAIWESMNGCDCPVDSRRDERCTTNVIRCNGRLGVVQTRMKEAGLTFTKTKEEG